MIRHCARVLCGTIKIIHIFVWYVFNLEVELRIIDWLTLTVIFVPLLFVPMSLDLC